MRLQLRLAILACCVLVGCRATQPPVTREALVGSYLYKSEDPEGRVTDHTLDHLVLQSDGRYDLVLGGSTKPRTETFGSWAISDVGNDGPEVELDHSGYPIQVKQNEIRLLIDNDVGIWYAKAK
jgi:hypothetical protein